MSDSKVNQRPEIVGHCDKVGLMSRPGDIQHSCLVGGIMSDRSYSLSVPGHFQSLPPDPHSLEHDSVKECYCWFTRRKYQWDGTSLNPANWSLLVVGEDCAFVDLVKEFRGWCIGVDIGDEQRAILVFWARCILESEPIDTTFVVWIEFEAHATCLLKKMCREQSRLAKNYSGWSERLESREHSELVARRYFVTCLCSICWALWHKRGSSDIEPGRLWREPLRKRRISKSLFEIWGGKCCARLSLHELVEPIDCNG